MDARDARPYARWALLAGTAIVAGLVPLLFMGPGTDLDTGAVIESGRLILDGDYQMSRPPGAPVHEAAVGVLERVGGAALANAGSLVAAVACCAGLAVLLRRHGVARPEAAVAVVAANPWFLVAATSTVDFAWAVALALWGAVALRAGRPLVAGALFGLAIGARMSTAILVAAAVVADAVGEGARPRRAAVVGGVAAGLGALLFVPAFLSAGGSLAFAHNDFRADSPLVHLGRWAAKNLYFVGPAAAVVLVATVPALARSLRRWRSSWLVRFGALGLAGSQLLFLRFPWKMGHLIPALVTLAVLLGVALARRPRLVWAVVALQLVYGVASVELLRPDRPHQARAASATFDPRWGPLVTDIRCRRQDPEAWRGDRERVEAVWSCAKPFGDGP